MWEGCANIHVNTALWASGRWNNPIGDGLALVNMIYTYAVRARDAIGKGRDMIGGFVVAITARGHIAVSYSETVSNILRGSGSLSVGEITGHTAPA